MTQSLEFSVFNTLISLKTYLDMYDRSCSLRFTVGMFSFFFFFNNQDSVSARFFTKGFFLKSNCSLTQLPGVKPQQSTNEKLLKALTKCGYIIQPCPVSQGA